MLQDNHFQALTNNGIHSLFSDSFEGQQFTLQIITYMPSEYTFTVFLSDGHAWIKGCLEGQAKKTALASSEIKCFTLIRFQSEDIRMNLQEYSFELLQIAQAKTTIHNIIGEPIPYEDYIKKVTEIPQQGLANSVGSNKIQNATTIYTLKEIKVLATGKISGAVVGKVIRKPDKVNNVMNIMIEDEAGDQIQCCFFASIAQKYHPILKVGGWYRFEDPVLQTNNRQDNCLELKINNQSNIEKVRPEGQKQQSATIGILRTNASYNQPKSEYKSKQSSYPEVQFKVKNFENAFSVEDCDYFVIARPLRINSMKGDIGRSLHCVDRFGCSFEITLWQEYASQEILLNETYKFTKMKAKIYRGQASLQSRKTFTKISVCSQKIMNRRQVSNPQLINNPELRALTKKERALSMSEIIYSLSEVTEKSSCSKERTCYFLVMGIMILRLDNWGNEYQFLNELRKKLFYTNCDQCQANEYIRTKIEPELINDKPSCSGCKSSNIRIMWNIKATLADSQMEISVKINSEIAEKLIGLTSAEGFREFLRNPEHLKRIVLTKINLLRGVYKISAKINDKKEGQRFFNVCQSYTDWLKAYYTRSLNEFKQAEEAYRQFCKPKDEPLHKYPIPTFLAKPKEDNKALSLPHSANPTILR